MALPLPQAPRGGFALDTLRAGNDFTNELLRNEYNSIINRFQPEKSRLENEHSGLVNQFYAPNIQSEISHRNALTNRTNTLTPLEAEQMGIANQWQPKLNAANIANTNSITNRNNTLTPLDAERMGIENKFLPDEKKASINAQNAMANWRNSGGAGAGVAQKDLNAFSRQLQNDNPQQPEESLEDYTRRINQMQSGYLSGDNAMPDGTPLPPLSGTGNQLLTTVQNRNSTVALKNQAAQLDILYKDLKSFDIDSVAKFAGPQGKAKLAYAQANMGINPNDPNIDPEARKFLTAMQQSIINMDKMRQAFGTSIVPEYVYQTIGKLTNPNSDVWQDGTQVKLNYQGVVDAIGRDRDETMAKAQRGVSAQAKEKDKGGMVKVKTPSGKIIELPKEGAERLLKDHKDHTMVK